MPGTFTPHRFLTICAFIILVLSLTGTLSAQYNESIVYNFPLTPNLDGLIPSSLVMDAAGNLYGTTYQGGSCPGQACGLVFKLSPSTGGWAETTLYSSDLPSGYMGAPLAMDASGNLYGVVSSGGFFNSNYCQNPGCGLVFELSPTSNGWTYTELFKFHGNDGGNPTGPPTLDAAGNLYGTTLLGGIHNDGTVFKLTHTASTWQHRALHVFTGLADGAQPNSPLTFDAAGNLYGTASGGGTSHFGTVFKLTLQASGNYTFGYIHAFTGGTKGIEPVGSLVVDAAGNVYGATLEGGSQQPVCELFDGCGIVYELVHSSNGYAEKVLHSFVAGVDGAVPLGGVIADSSGNLYGTTSRGVKSVAGTVFELSPSGATWTETLLYTGSPNYIVHGFTQNLLLTPSGDLFGSADGTLIFELSPVP